MTERYWDRYSRRRTGRRSFLIGGATMALGTAAILVGCGDDDDDSPGNTPDTGNTPGTGNTPDTGSTPGSTPTMAPSAGVHGGTYRVSTLDPHRGSDPMINTLEPVFHTPRVYSWTHRYNVSENKFIMDMATEMEYVDATTLRIKIRPDIKFHNVAPMNGRLVTSQDLVYTYQRFPLVREKGSSINPLAYNWMDLEALETPDDQTIVIKQNAPFAEAQAMMAQHFFGVIAKEVDQANGGDLSQVNTAGCGPYILTESDPSTRMLWTRNPDYFSHDHSDQSIFPEGGGYPDAYEQRVTPDPNTTQAQLISGELDQLYYNILNVDRLLAEQLRSQGLNVDEGQANTNVSLVMNMPTFPDTRSRQAIRAGIDYQGFIDTVFLGDGELGAPVGNGFTDAVRIPRDRLSDFLQYNPQEARQMWDAVPDSAKKSKYIMLGIANFPFMEQATGFVKQSLESSLGIEVEIQAVDIPSWIARAQAEENDWDFLVQFSQSTPDVPTFNILGSFDPNGTAARTAGFSPESSVPEIADLARQVVELSKAHYEEVDLEARTPKLHAFQEFVLENALPAIPLPVRKIDWLVTNKRVKNVPVGNPNFFRSNLVDNMWLDPNQP